MTEQLNVADWPPNATFVVSGCNGWIAAAGVIASVPREPLDPVVVLDVVVVPVVGLVPVPVDPAEVLEVVVVPDVVEVLVVGLVPVPLVGLVPAVLPVTGV